jgi:hypothetical protein
MKSKDQTLLEEAYNLILEAGMPPTAGLASRVGATGGVQNPGVHPSLERIISDNAKSFLNKRYKQVQQTAIVLAANSYQPLVDLKAAIQKMATEESPLTEKDINSISEYYLKQAGLMVNDRTQDVLGRPRRP